MSAFTDVLYAILCAILKAIEGTYYFFIDVTPILWRKLKENTPPIITFTSVMYLESAGQHLSDPYASPRTPPGSPLLTSPFASPRKAPRTHPRSPSSRRRHPSEFRSSLPRAVKQRRYAPATPIMPEDLPTPPHSPSVGSCGRPKRRCDDLFQGHWNLSLMVDDYELLNNGLNEQIATQKKTYELREAAMKQHYEQRETALREQNEKRETALNKQYEKNEASSTDEFVQALISRDNLLIDKDSEIMEKKEEIADKDKEIETLTDRVETAETDAFLTKIENEDLEEENKKLEKPVCPEKSKAAYDLLAKETHDAKALHLAAVEALETAKQKHAEELKAAKEAQGAAKKKHAKEVKLLQESLNQMDKDWTLEAKEDAAETSQLIAALKYERAQNEELRSVVKQREFWKARCAQLSRNADVEEEQENVSSEPKQPEPKKSEQVLIEEAMARLRNSATPLPSNTVRFEDDWCTTDGESSVEESDGAGCDDEWLTTDTESEFEVPEPVTPAPVRQTAPRKTKAELMAKALEQLYSDSESDKGN